MNIRSLMTPLAISASGLAAQRLRADTVAMNLANAQTTRTPEGGPYRRQVVELGPQALVPRPVDFNQSLKNRVLSMSKSGHMPVGLTPDNPLLVGGGVRIEGIVQDMTDGQIVYDPGHPDADENGYVRMPNVDVTTEMVDLMIARRAYEANATAFEAAKGMIKRAIDI